MGATTKVVAASAGTELSKPYEVTPEERAALAAHLARMDQNPWRHG